ncbi:MAG: hypothetical protein P8X75_02565 [Limibacillus sp.]
MYRDNTLIPSEAIRLLALGFLAEEEAGYADLASAVRHFTARVVGPSLELVAAPLELLKVEGLIEKLDEEDQDDNSMLRITEAGREEVTRLLCAGVRAPTSDVNKLILAIKLRLLHLLERAEAARQVDLLAEVAEKELARLEDLKKNNKAATGLLPAWLDLEIEQARARVAWFEAQADRLAE